MPALTPTAFLILASLKWWYLGKDMKKWMGNNLRPRSSSLIPKDHRFDHTSWNRSDLTTRLQRGTLDTDCTKLDHVTIHQERLRIGSTDQGNTNRSNSKLSDGQIV